MTVTNPSDTCVRSFLETFLSPPACSDLLMLYKIFIPQIAHCTRGFWYAALCIASLTIVPDK